MTEMTTQFSLATRPEAGSSRKVAPGSGPAHVRLGVIVPSVNTVVEPWFGAAAPTGAAVHTARMHLDDNLTPEAVRRMDQDEGMRAARQIASCRPSAIAYCCTASSIVQGVEYDRRLQEHLAQATGLPSFTAVGAIVDALHVVGARRIAVASPYPEAIDRMEHTYFSEAGFTVVGSANLGIADSFQLAAPTPTELFSLGRRAWRKDADALLMTCLNMRSHTVVEALEQHLGRPVITSTQATLWKLMRSAGLKDRLGGYGTLLASY